MDYQEQRDIAAALSETPTYSSQMHNPEAKVIINTSIQRCDMSNDVARERLSSEMQTLVASHMNMLARQLSFVTYPEFMHQFAKSCEWFNQQVSGRRFALMVDAPQKSSTWLANIAWELLAAAPYCFLTHRMYFHNIGDLVNLILPTDIVYFDDAGYSGTQLAERIVALNQALEGSAVKMTLYLCVPYLSPRAKERILKAAAASFWLRVVMYPQHQVISNIRDIAEMIGLNWMPTSMPGQFFYNAFQNPIETLTLTFFEHKIPDAVSLPQAFKFCIPNDIRNSLHVEPYKHTESYAYTFPTRARTPLCLLQGRVSASVFPTSQVQSTRRITRGGRKKSFKKSKKKSFRKNGGCK